MILGKSQLIVENNEKLKDISNHYYKNILNKYTDVAPLKIGDCFHFFGKNEKTCISSLSEFTNLPVPTVMREIWVLTGIEYEPIEGTSSLITVLIFTNIVTGKVIRNEVVESVMNTIAIGIKDRTINDGRVKLLRIDQRTGIPVHEQFAECIFNRLVDLADIHTSKLVRVYSILENQYAGRQFKVIDIRVGDMVPYYITQPEISIYNIGPGSAVLKVKDMANGYIDYITHTELVYYVNSNSIQIL